jgi:hypothetical protein
MQPRAMCMRVRSTVGKRPTGCSAAAFCAPYQTPVSVRTRRVHGNDPDREPSVSPSPDPLHASRKGLGARFVGRSAPVFRNRGRKSSAMECHAPSNRPACHCYRRWEPSKPNETTGDWEDIQRFRQFYEFADPGSVQFNVCTESLRIVDVKT